VSSVIVSPIKNAPLTLMKNVPSGNRPPYLAMIHVPAM
jgi:hypothetical protein